VGEKINSLKPRVNKVHIETCSISIVERIRGYKLTKIRERIMLRDLYACQACGRVTVDGEVDHKIPLHLGGIESDENRQYLCVPCHAIKTEQEEKDRVNIS
jgi:5-methylcytosine-specific restriction protein A